MKTIRPLKDRPPLDEYYPLCGKSTGKLSARNAGRTGRSALFAALQVAWQAFFAKTHTAHCPK